ncbi:MAG: alpha/beta hydrolase [Chitinophagaceae bacterium]
MINKANIVFSVSMAGVSPATFLSVLFLGLILFADAQQPGAKTAAIKTKWLDIGYAEISPAQKLDIYLPDSNSNKYPVIISIHGGAFMMGDKADAQVTPMLEGLQHGYAVVSINYRLSSEALFPKNIEDLKTAIRWVKANAVNYKLNPGKIAVWGNSAGGYLAALAGTSGGIMTLEDLSLGNPDQVSRVQAVVDWYGPINFLKMDEQLKATGYGIPNHNEVNSPESKLMGQQIMLIPEKVKLANPENYISKDDPPFLIMHGEEDQLVPAQQSIIFSHKLKNVLGKEKITLHVIENAHHGGPEFEKAENLKMVFDFLDKYLK